MKWFNVNNTFLFAQHWHWQCLAMVAAVVLFELGLLRKKVLKEKLYWAMNCRNSTKGKCCKH